MQLTFISWEIGRVSKNRISSYFRLKRKWPKSNLWITHDFLFLIWWEKMFSLSIYDIQLQDSNMILTIKSYHLSFLDKVTLVNFRRYHNYFANLDWINWMIAVILRFICQKLSIRMIFFFDDVEIFILSSFMMEWKFNQNSIRKPQGNQTISN